MNKAQQNGGRVEIRLEFTINRLLALGAQRRFDHSAAPDVVAAEAAVVAAVRRSLVDALRPHGLVDLEINGARLTRDDIYERVGLSRSLDRKDL
jgi:hypothetical protein